MTGEARTFAAPVCGGYRAAGAVASAQVADAGSRHRDDLWVRGAAIHG